TNAHWTLHAAVDNPWFAGHFPDQPILPGVVQIGWAAWFASRWYDTDLQPSLLERVKFTHPIVPPADLTLHLQLKTDKLHYEYHLLLPDAPISASRGIFVLPDPVT